MAQLLKLFELHAEHVFETRSRSFVWFLISLIGPLIMLLFWRGSSSGIKGWNLSFITSYYFLLVVAGSFLMSHIEEGIALEDIYEGELVKYMLKPFSYIKLKFIEELPYRLLQGFFGVLVVGIYILFFGKFFAFSNVPMVILLSIVIMVLSYCIGFLYKGCVGLLAFWVTDIGGIFHFSDIMIFVFSGYIVPIFLFPAAIEKFAYFLPFGYIVYYPVIAFQGQLAAGKLIQIILIQLFWIVAFYTSYRILWASGIKKFTGIGQ